MESTNPNFPAAETECNSKKDYKIMRGARGYAGGEIQDYLLENST
jgi:hypothetical protein